MPPPAEGGSLCLTIDAAPCAAVAVSPAALPEVQQTSKVARAGPPEAAVQHCRCCRWWRRWEGKRALGLGLPSSLEAEELRLGVQWCWGGSWVLRGGLSELICYQLVVFFFFLLYLTLSRALQVRTAWGGGLKAGAEVLSAVLTPLTTCRDAAVGGDCPRQGQPGPCVLPLRASSQGSTVSSVRPVRSAGPGLLGQCWEIALSR